MKFTTLHHEKTGSLGFMGQLEGVLQHIVFLRVYIVCNNNKQKEYEQL